MCGIAGIIDCGANLGRQSLRDCAARMSAALVHRGPDDAGIWVDDAGVCALAHRRLAIIDLSPEGQQPLGNEDGSVQVTFNGEIYNYRELRAELESRGHFFRSKTDSEVLPHLFEDMEAERVQRLDGMFAFGVWHQERRRLILARDPFGKKPLYYVHGPGWFAFASELHALEQLPDFDMTLDRDALAFYLLLQYIPAPWTIYRRVKKLPPGSFLEVSFSRSQGAPVRVRSYTRFQPRKPRFLERPRSFAMKVERLRALLIEAVAKRLVGDVPLGAFLSGGVDSSLVVAIMKRELEVPVQTFSIGFEGTDETEHHAARAVAEHLGCEHHEEILRPNVLDLVSEIAEMLDEPNGDSSCLPTYLLSRFARRHVTVALSGDGGDEMFGGYRRYQDTLLECGDWRQRLARSWRNGRWFTPADAYLSNRYLSYQPDQVRRLLGDLPPAVAGRLAHWRSRLNDWSLPLIHRMRALDAEIYLPGAVLPKVDRMSMQVALEVRCPLLDRDVAAFAESLTSADCWRPGETKRILKHVAARYLPAQWLQRPKMGFGVPANTWSMEQFLEMAHDLLLPPSSRLGAEVNPAALRTLLEEQSRPGWFSIYQVWPLLILELWLRKTKKAAPATELVNR
jgi:asparagine synthase (glutamine-hydrolysing)